jgi:cytochrome c553
MQRSIPFPGSRGLRRATVFCAAALALLSLAHGEERDARVTAGKTTSLACQACHGSNGVNPSADIPNLAGQKRAYLAAQLKAFKAGERKNDLMNAIASQLGETDIDNLAAYWSSVPMTAEAAASSPLEPSRSPMTFPEGFPQGFAVYRSDTDAQDGTVTKLYANEIAATAARAGKPLPHGAVIISSAYSPATKSQSYSAMESRAGWGDEVPELLRNGDWRYALFDGDRHRLEGFNYARCLACHKPAVAASYVFTLDALARSTH